MFVYLELSNNTCNDIIKGKIRIKLSPGMTLYLFYNENDTKNDAIFIRFFSFENDAIIKQ